MHSVSNSSLEKKQFAGFARQYNRNEYVIDCHWIRDLESFSLLWSTGTRQTSLVDEVRVGCGFD